MVRVTSGASIREVINIAAIVTRCGTEMAISIGNKKMVRNYSAARSNCLSELIRRPFWTFLILVTAFHRNDVSNAQKQSSNTS
jgi:hypothetical protein